MLIKVHYDKFIYYTSKYILVILLVGIIGCVTKPGHIQPVKNFDAKKYIGKWYEIARFDNSFEKGMTDVYAEYSLTPYGSIQVINSGVKSKTGKRSYAKGVAKFLNDSTIGYLKVSFCRPFYSAYVVFQIDDRYEYAYVAGNDKNYLWLLARTPSVSKSIKQDFIEKAKALGFDTDKLIWVNHSADFR